MDMWDSGYSDGFRDALMTVQELADEQPDMRAAEVLEALRAERDLQFEMVPRTTFDPH